MTHNNFTPGLGYAIGGGIFLVSGYVRVAAVVYRVSRDEIRLATPSELAALSFAKGTTQ